ncbi:MAG: hypothetical protein MR663_14145, partial [Lachnospiraceae bacterium]|nr:hypothetical protein [Lachnospiraceae bacterium]
TTEYDLQWLVAGRIAAGRGLAITYKMQVQQPTKTFCNFMQKRLAKNIDFEKELFGSFVKVTHFDMPEIMSYI